MNKAIYLVTINEIKELLTGYKGKKNVIVSITWAYPRENVKQIVHVIDLGKLPEGKNTKNFKDDEFSKRIIFKEEQLGESYLIIEISVVKDAQLISKIINAVLTSAAGMLTNPLVGSAVKAIVKSLDIGDNKVISIAKGKIDLNETINDGEYNTVLTVPSKFSHEVENDQYDEGIDDEDDEFLKVIKPNDINGEISLNFTKLG